MANKGPFIYSQVENLQGKPKVFDGQCAGLVQWHTRAGKAATWRKGIDVRGNLGIAVGTAVATFVGNTYPNKEHGNHAALYVSQNGAGLALMDQWSTKASIAKRTLPYLGKNPDGTYIDPSNNGDAFSVIMHE